MIVEIRNGVDTVVDKMDGSIKSVDSSVKAIEENGHIFSEINRQAEQFKDIVANVMESVRVMYESSCNFEHIMQEINDVSQEFASNS